MTVPWFGPAWRLVLGLAALLLASLPGKAATKGDYCYTPPSIASSLPPNVMIVLDNSGSMLNFAYDFVDSDGDGFTASGEVSSGYDPGQTYYGYFKSDYFYEYSSSKFRESRPKSGNTIASGEWDGNFLNWLTMRRVDVLRKVLTGGDYSSSTLVGEAPDIDGRGRLKSYANPGDVSPCSASGFAVTTQGGTAVFESTTGSGCPENSYKVQVTTSSSISGLLDEIWDNVRFGLGFFAEVNNSGSGDTEFQGGIVSRHVDATTLSDFRSGVNEKYPETSTPLAETLYTMTGYFAQADTYSDLGLTGGPDPDWGENRYSIGVDGKDPYYFTSHGEKASCAQSFILYLTDGDPTQDGEIPDDAAGLGDFDGDGADPGSYGSNGTGYFDDVALYARTQDLRGDLAGSQNVVLYPVFAFGTGSDLIKQAAKNGGFEDIDGDGRPYTSGDCQIGQDNSSAAAECDEWDEDRDGVPDTYFEADTAGKLEEVLRQAFTAILERASSGSTVATISTQTRSGGELLQAYYLPKETESGSAGTTEVAWKGYLRGLWTDGRGNMREDAGGDDLLKPAEDRILQFYFDIDDQQVMARLFSDSDDGDGVPDTCDPAAGGVASQKSVDVTPLWEAGKQLAVQEPPDRTIWFNDAGSLTEFTVTNDAAVEDYWTPEIPLADSADLIKFLRGYDNPNGSASFRQRQAEDWSSSDYGGNSGEPVWKLGAIITSTPRVLRQGAVSTYSDANGSYHTYYNGSNIQGRASMAFVGANDGMLHAFYVGDVEASSSSGVSAELKEESATKPPGKEAWAFIPRNALPYLRWYGELDVECHIPTVDYRTQLVDVATNGSWKTLLIGTMGFGGRSIGCDLDADGSTESTLSSSIFVLDVTDPGNPSLVWESALPDGSLTLTYPAVVHKGGGLKEGSWYLVAGSGPQNVAGSGPNDPSSPSFSGSPALYVFDLYDGSLEGTLSIGTSGVAVGEPLPLDPDRDDITDSVMFGTYNGAGGGDGKLYRLQLTGTVPADWELREAAVIPANTESGSVAGRPFFAAPGVAKDELDNFWVYAATGRFMGEADQTTSEDPQFMFGYIEDCWGDGVNDSAAEGDSGCSGPTTPVEVQNDLVHTKGITAEGTATGLQCRCGSIRFEPPEYDSGDDSYSCPAGSDKVITDVKGVSYTCDSEASGDGADCTSVSDLRGSIRDKNGWYWRLSAPERVFSQPFVRAGLVNVLGFSPVSDICDFGGTTTVHAVDYRTGTAPAQPVFLNASGFTGSMGSSGEIETSIDLGRGVPPLGEGFAAMPASGDGEVGSLTQTSTGQVSPTQQQSDKLKSGILFLREP